MVLLDKAGDEVLIWYLMGAFSADSNNPDTKLNILPPNDWGIEMFWAHDTECTDGPWSAYDWGAAGIRHSSPAHAVALLIPRQQFWHTHYFALGVGSWLDLNVVIIGKDSEKLNATYYIAKAKHGS